MPDSTLRILEKMLDVAAYRHKILASNIANADTPGYKAKDISFQQELDKAVSTGKAGSYELFETPSTMPSRDGNTVNLDIEMAKVAENTLLYNTATQLMAMKVRMVKDIIKGGQ